MNEQKLAQSNGHHPQPARQRPSPRQEMDAARALLAQVREITGVRFRVFRVNAADWVAAPDVEAARDWYVSHKGNDAVVEDPVREVPLNTYVNCEYGQMKKALWLLIAEHFRDGIKYWDPSTPFPAHLIEPYVIASTED